MSVAGIQKAWRDGEIRDDLGLLIVMSFAIFTRKIVLHGWVSPFQIRREGVTKISITVALT